tara:strand:- start:5140 stop:7350 length:2211 start_codon:yes stop_codon:yes gene_type:complete
VYSNSASVFHCALVGYPNSGKSTFFNALSGAHQKVGNWFGVTVDSTACAVELESKTLHLADLPGIHDIAFHEDERDCAIDEAVTRRYVMQKDVDVIINVVDAHHLERHLYLTLQLLELGLPMVVVLNKIESAQKKGIKIDIDALSKQLTVPVLCVTPDDQSSISNIKSKLNRLDLLACQPQCKLTYSDTVESYLAQAKNIAVLPYLAKRAQVLARLHVMLPKEDMEEVDIEIASTRYQRVESICHEAVQDTNKKKISDYLDLVFLHKYWGVPLFLVVMYAVFMFAIGVGNSWIDFFSILAGAFFVDYFAYMLTSLGASEVVVQLLAQGVGGGIQTVISFIPVMVPLFIALSVLESSGYLSRASFVIEGAMKRIGLPGKAFVPMVVGFGCSVPAIMATRSLNKERERIITGMMTPFMSCGARLPIYVLFAATFFPSSSESLVFLLYCIGLLAALGTGLLLSRTVLPGYHTQQVMELSAYQVPRLDVALQQAYKRMMSFICGEGKIIVIAVAFLTLLNSFSMEGEVTKDASILQVISQEVTPVFSPIGIQEDNWPATVGIIVGLFAKEVVVGTLNSLYSVPDQQSIHSKRPSLSQAWDDACSRLQHELAAWLFWVKTPQPLDTSGQTSMLQNLSQGFGSTSAAFAYLLLILLYTPCISAIAALIKEFGMMWALASSLWTSYLAYAVAALYYQSTLFMEQPGLSTAWIAFFISGFVLIYWILRKQSQKTPELIPVLEIN